MLTANYLTPINNFCFFSFPLKHFAVLSVYHVCFFVVTLELGFASRFFLWCGNGVFEFSFFCFKEE